MSATVTVPRFWVFHYRCGHVFGILFADQRPQRVIATEEHAWRDFYRGRKKRAAKRRAAGCYVTPSELVPELSQGEHNVELCEGLTIPLFDVPAPLAPAATTETATIRCPECATGKHGNCDGTALDTTTDKFVPCPCAADEHGRGKAPGAIPADHSSDECSFELCTYCGCCAHGQSPAKGCPVESAPAGMRCPNSECGCEGQA